MQENKFESSLKLIVSTSFFVLMGIMISKVFTYVYKILIAKNFGPTEYGVFSLAVTILTLFVSLGYLGLWEGVLRTASLYKGKESYNKLNYLFKLSIITSLLSSVLAGIMMFIFAEPISLQIFNSSALILYLKWFSILVPATTIYQILLSFLRAFEYVKTFSFLQNIMPGIIKAVLLVIFILVGLKSNAVILSYSLSVLSVLLLSYIFIQIFVMPSISKKKISEGQKISIRKELFSFSLPVMLTSLLGVIFTYINTLMIGYFLGVKEVGFFNAALPIAMIFLIFPEIFMQLLFPLITKEFSKNNLSLIRDLSSQVNKWIFIINLFILFAVEIFAEYVIVLLFNEKFLAAALCLRILALGYFVFSMYSISTNLMLMAGKSKTLLYNTIIFSIINICLNFVLIREFGINGGALAVTLCFLLWGITAVLQAKKYSKVLPFTRNFIKILACGIISFLISLLLKENLAFFAENNILLGVVFALTYLVLLIITRCVDKRDILIISSIRNKFRM